MTVPNDTFHRPGNHILGAGVVYFSTSDGGPERPIIETDQLTLNTVQETVKRKSSVDGPAHTEDEEVVSVERTLTIGTSDIIEKNLGLYFGELDTEDVASASGTKTITSPNAGEWFQIVEHPQPVSVSSVSIMTSPGELTEGVDYQLDLQRGRIQFLVDGYSSVDVDYEAEGTRVLTVGPQKVVRGQLRFISDPTQGTGYDLYFPNVVLKPSSSMEFKSRAEWMRIGLEIQVLGSILEMVESTSAVVSSPPVVVIISQSEPLTISASYPVDVEGATIEFDATRRGGSKEIDIDYAGDPSNFTVDSEGNVDVVLADTDTNVTLGTYDGVLKVTDGSSNEDSQSIVIVVQARETVDLGDVDAPDLVATPVATECITSPDSDVPTEGHHFCEVVTDEIGIEADCIIHHPTWDASAPIENVGTGSNGSIVGTVSLEQTPPADSGLLHSVDHSGGGRLETPDTLDTGSDSFTVLIWFQGSVGGADGIWGKSVGGSERCTAYTQSSANTIRFDLFDGSNLARVTASGFLDSAWHAMVCRVDWSTEEMEMWIDGTSQGSASISSVALSDSSAQDFRWASSYYIGSPIPKSAGPYAFNVALSDADCARLSEGTVS